MLRDYQVSLGGPIMKDRIWFFFNYRAVDAADAQPGIFANKNAGDPTKWTYEPDFTQQGRADPHRKIASLRLTTQITPKNKLTVFWDEQPQCNGAGWGDDDHCNSQKDGWIYGGSQVERVLRPRARTRRRPVTTPARTRACGRSSTPAPRPASCCSRPASAPTSRSGATPSGRATRPTSLIRVQEQTTQFFDANGNRVSAATPGGLTVGGDLKYRSSNWPTGYICANTWNASASYVTGSHNMKFGYQGALPQGRRQPVRHHHEQPAHDLPLRGRRESAAGQSVGYGVPNQVTIQAGPWTRFVRTGYTAFFAQDQWTTGRMTVQGAVRFDRAYSQFPEQTIPQDVWWPTEFVMPEAKGIDAYKNISPRVGLAYDLFGNGKTSFKANLGRYMHPASNDGRYVAPNPAARAVTLASRPWTDANGNYVVDCDLLNAAVQDKRATGGDLCGQGDANYGKNRSATSLDPSILNGWNARPNDWQFGVSVQQEVMPRVSVEVGYYRRWWPIYDGVDVTDNIAVAPSEFGQFSVVAPSRSAPAEWRRLHDRRPLQHHACRGGARRGERAQGRQLVRRAMTATGTAST